MGLLFFPRGGSSHVAQNLATALPAAGWRAAILSGALSLPARPGDARAFYRGLDVHTVDFTPALDAADPLAADPPFHPSYEDRADAPDAGFARLGDAAFEHQVAAWARALEAAGAADADVLHLHHLTPINEAAARVAPGVPVVGHLHGTELLMLERIAAGAPPSWAHAGRWAERMGAWARACERIVLLSETQVERAEQLLGVDADRCTVVSNGYDPTLFEPAEEKVDRRALWRRVLVEEPRGWRPGGEEGSVAYRDEDLDAFGEGPVLLYVGRFTEVKRIGLLIEAHARAQYAVRTPLVLVGGHPGEWEGEHPAEAIERTGARDVFLAGWHEHDELPELLQASGALVLPSVREQFGQVLVEAMACAVPCIAVDRFGPAGIVRDGETGWLVEPDDVDALRQALEQAAGDPEERRRRGALALEDARARYSWPALAGL